MNEKTVVLAGAGHAHLYVAARAKAFRQRGWRLVVVDPGSFWYSGLATGMLGGRYEAADDQLDVADLVESCGGELLRDRVVAIDVRNQRLPLQSGGAIRYDLLSLNLGSVIDCEAIEGMTGDPRVYPVKPISRLWQLRQDLEQSWARGKLPRLAVVGGGASGCEVAANLLALARANRVPAQVTLVSGGERLLPSAPTGASLALEKYLRARGLSIFHNSRVTARTVDGVGIEVSSERQEISADWVVLATGLKAHPLVSRAGLLSHPAKGLCIDAQLRSPEDRRVFAAGDCAHMLGHELPKLGVFGVRQARFIHDNLLATIDGRPLHGYLPQSRWLSILNLGEGQALALRGSRWWLGRASMYLKDYLDRRFLAHYRALSRGRSR